MGTEARVGMLGEFDACSLPQLRKSLDDAFASGRPVVVELSGVTFLDVDSTLELVMRSLIQGRLLSFVDPSSCVLASVRALGMPGSAGIRPGHEEPPILSES